MRSNEETLSIAQTATINVMTDGSIRIIEFHPYGGGDDDDIIPIYCSNDEEALMYLRATGALSTNPDWYRHE